MLSSALLGAARRAIPIKSLTQFAHGYCVEYADVFGVPFDFTAKPVVAATDKAITEARAEAAAEAGKDAAPVLVERSRSAPHRSHRFTAAWRSSRSHGSGSEPYQR